MNDDARILSLEMKVEQLLTRLNLLEVRTATLEQQLTQAFNQLGQLG